MSRRISTSHTASSLNHQELWFSALQEASLSRSALVAAALQQEPGVVAALQQHPSSTAVDLASGWQQWQQQVRHSQVSAAHGHKQAVRVSHTAVPRTTASSPPPRSSLLLQQLVVPPALQPSPQEVAVASGQLQRLSMAGVEAAAKLHAAELGTNGQVNSAAAAEAAATAAAQTQLQRLKHLAKEPRHRSW